MASDDPIDPVEVLGEEEVEERVEDATVPCEFLCGVAGSGKTFQVRSQCESDPSWGLLCATTGIAAVNLSTVTLNSILRFFDTDSLRDAYLNGLLVRRLRQVRKLYRRLVIDEISMMDGEQLGILVRGTLEANSFKPKRGEPDPPLALMLVGDFAQLPPVKARWAFESDEWHRFEAATTRLTKVWRQDAGPFLTALNLARAGRGEESAEVLSAEGLEWNSALDIDFQGTTIVPRNDQVDRYNRMALDRMAGRVFTLTNRRWGKQRGEWKQVPDRIDLKVGAYVMLLSNSYDEGGRLVYANGDCGFIKEYGEFDNTLYIRLVRNDDVISVRRIVRGCDRSEKPTGWDGPVGRGEWLPVRHWQSKQRRFVEGQLQYWPLRLAYASTVHKSQGLSLDRIQVDIRDHFFSAPAMEYVALSRCRTLEGLRVVGQRERYIRNCKCDPRVRPWL